MPFNQREHRTSSGASLRTPHASSPSGKTDPRGGGLRPAGVAPKSRIPVTSRGGSRSAACSCFGRPLMAADKVDVIHLKNGDRLTCEIKKLDRSGTSHLPQPALQFSANAASADHDARTTTIPQQRQPERKPAVRQSVVPIGWGQFQQNQELSLDLRVVCGGGFGRDLVHSYGWSPSGLAYTHEQFSGEPAISRLKQPLAGSWTSSRRARGSGLPTASCRIST